METQSIAANNISPGQDDLHSLIANKEATFIAKTEKDFIKFFQ